MKKLLLSIALLATITFIACEEDNVFPTVSYSGCQVCEIAADSLSNLENENYEICVGAADSLVYVDGANTGLHPERYFELFCDNAYGEVSPSNPNCVTCAAYTVGGTAMPQVEICQGDNGNAFINNIDLEMTYQEAITAYSAATTCE